MKIRKIMENTYTLVLDKVYRSEYELIVAFNQKCRGNLVTVVEGDVIFLSLLYNETRYYALMQKWDKNFNTYDASLLNAMNSKEIWFEKLCGFDTDYYKYTKIIKEKSCTF